MLKYDTNDKTKLALLAEFDTVLGIGLIAAAEKIRDANAAESDPRIDALVAARTEAKKARNWAEADRIRDALKADGILITDTPEGPIWKRV